LLALQTLSPILDVVLDAVIQMLPAWASLLPPVMELITAIMPLIPLLGQVVSFIVGLLVPALVWVTQHIAEFAGMIIGGLASAIAWLISVVPGAWTTVKNAVVGFVTGAVAKLGEFRDWIMGIPRMILDAIGNLGSLLYDSGAALLRGLMDGFMSMVQTVKNKVSGALGSIRNLFPFSPAVEGPFSGTGWVSYSGQSIAEAFAGGIDARSALAADAASRMAGLTRDGLDTPLGAGSAGGGAVAVAGGGGGRSVLEIRSGGAKMDDLLVEVLIKAIRVRGGNVQVVLGS
jgi:hypothetical protein